MGIRKNIQRILIALLWSGSAVAMVVLLAAAMREKKEKKCTAVEISFSNDKEPVFLNEEDIRGSLTENGRHSLEGKLIRTLDLQQLEQRLKREIGIGDAEIYLDNRQALKVLITERQPVARVFTTEGNSFYIDSSRVHIPVTHKRPLQLPVFTGYPDQSIDSLERDQQLQKGIISISQLLSSDPFWNALVSQVNITSEGQFELLPTLGDYVIELGNGSEMEKKFRKLSLFYKQVFAHTGPEAYVRIKLQYNGQVIGQRKDILPGAYDSSQVVRTVGNLLRLIHKNQDQFEDSLSRSMANDRSKVMGVGKDKKQQSITVGPQGSQKIKTTKTDRL
jgi:cell division protein FtsQ